MKNMTKKILVLLTVVSLAPLLHADVFTDLASYKYGDASNAPDELDKAVLAAGPAGRAAIEKKLIALLQSSEATEVGKGYACRMLQRIGTAASVPALSGLLHDKVLSHYARLPLEQMTDIPAAGAALRGALAGAPDCVKPGILASLGERRDTQAVAQVAKLLSSSDSAVTAAALRALGKIGGQASLQALTRAKVPAALADAHLEATIACAADVGSYATLNTICQSASNSAVQRIAALTEMVAIDDAKASAVVVDLIEGKPGPLRRGALRLVVTAPGAELTGALVGSLGQLDGPGRAQVVELLGKRGDVAALPGVTGQLGSTDDAVRTAAIAAVAELGGAAEVPALLQQVKADAVGAKALDALAKMSADGVDEALTKSLTDSALCGAAIKALAKRGARSAAPRAIKLTTDSSQSVRLAAWEAMGQLATENDAATLMKIALAIKDPGERKAAQDAIRWICSEATDRNKCFDAIAAFYGQADETTKLFILELGPSAGTDTALSLEKAALKSGNAQQRDKALRALAAWPNADAAPELLAIARESAGDTEGILALRGFIQIAGAGGSNKDKVGRYLTASELAKRPDEKRLLISKLKDNRTIESFRVIKNYLADPAVQAEAEIAAIDLANRIGSGRNRDEVAATLTSIAETSKNKGAVKRANDCLKKLPPKK